MKPLLALWSGSLLALLSSTALTAQSPAAGAGAAASDPTAPGAAAGIAGTGGPAVRLSALHVSSFGSMRSARMEAAGAMDTGACVLVLLDDDSGSPLVPLDLDYVADPAGFAELGVSFTQMLGDVNLSARVLGVGLTRNGDERLKLIVRLTFENLTHADQVARLGARLLPGDGDPARRPLPSLPFRTGLQFARDGNFITRDGAVLATWVGLDPEVVIPEPPASAAEPACELHWALPLPAQSARYLDIVLAGPRAGEADDESAWRAAMTRQSYAQVNESLGWQSMFRGFYADFKSASAPLGQAMVAAVHALRMLGDADREIRQLSDRPFGHPASDEAVPAEMVALFTEWNWIVWATPRVALLVESAEQTGATLSPARRVALVHGLSRAVRLVTEAALAQTLAAAIRALVTEPVEVDPWLDPAEVRLDLLAILEWNGPAADDGAVDPLPELRWATGLQRRVDVKLQEMRRALSVDDAVGAWAACKDLLTRTTALGFFRDEDSGELDVRTTLGFMTLVRAMFIEDHGDDLHVFARVPMELIPVKGVLNLTILPTRFGLVDAEMHMIGGKGKLGTQIATHMIRPVPHLWLHVPRDVRAAAVQGPLGGTATLVENGSIDCWVDPAFKKGLRFNIKLEKE